MSLEEIIVQGTLKPDGTLELDQRPNLPPGRVSVVLRSLPQLPANDPFFAMLQEIWDARARAGLTPRSVAEVEAQRQRLRDESAEEVAEAMRLQQEDRAGQENASPSNGGGE
jgi:hypothetical protein